MNRRGFIAGSVYIAVSSLPLIPLPALADSAYLAPLCRHVEADWLTFWEEAGVVYWSIRWREHGGEWIETSGTGKRIEFAPQRYIERCEKGALIYWGTETAGSFVFDMPMECRIGTDLPLPW